MPKTLSPLTADAANAGAPSVEHLIHVIGDQKVMLDSDLAALYGVSTKRLNEAVKRNLLRFPRNFMFQLTPEEAVALRSQNATSKGGRRYVPYVFTEHGVVMLSAILNSERAVQVSIFVVNAFVRMRELLATNRDIANRVEKLERGQGKTVSVIEILLDDIERLAKDLKQTKALPASSGRRIGFPAASGI